MTAKIALASAAAVAAVPGSPIPPGASPFRTRCTWLDLGSEPPERVRSGIPYPMLTAATGHCKPGEQSQVAPPGLEPGLS